VKAVAFAPVAASSAAERMANARTLAVADAPFADAPSAAAEANVIAAYFGGAAPEEIKTPAALEPDSEWQWAFRVVLVEAGEGMCSLEEFYLQRGEVLEEAEQQTQRQKGTVLETIWA